jgi:hypothetical protein
VRRAGCWRRAGVLLVGLSSCGFLGRSDPPEATPVEVAGIEREVAARLAAEPSIGPGRVRVEVLGRTVALYGSVRGIGALHCAIRNAELVQGVRNVADYLVLEPGPREVRCLAPRTFRA